MMAPYFYIHQTLYVHKGFGCIFYYMTGGYKEIGSD